MAEERLIDTDKDKKYRFRINENGEEELIIDDGLTEEEENPREEMEFEVPEEDCDDEEAAVMTPEQLAEKRRLAEQKEREKNEKISSCIAAAVSDSAEGKYATALESLQAAEELDPCNGRIHSLKLRVYTREFTSYEGTLDKAALAAEDVKKYADKESKEQMLAVAEDGLKKQIAELTRRVDALSAENEAKKNERAVRFNKDNKKAAIIFGCVALPFAIFLALAIYFSTVMFAVQSSTNVVLTVVFAALAFVLLIALAFASRRWNIAARRVRLNKNDSKTKLGREYLAEKHKLEKFTAILSALKD